MPVTTRMYRACQETRWFVFVRSSMPSRQRGHLRRRPSLVIGRPRPSSVVHRRPCRPSLSRRRRCRCRHRNGTANWPSQGMTTSSCILVLRSSWGGVAVAVRARRSSVKVGVTGSGHTPVLGGGRSTHPARPSLPSLDHHPSSPSSSLLSSDRRPSSPSSDRRPSSPSSDRRPSSPSSDRRPSSPSSDRCPSSPSSDRCPSSPSSDHRPSSPSSSPPSSEQPGEWARADVDGAVSRRRCPLSGGARCVHRCHCPNHRRPSHRHPSGPSLVVVAI